MRARRRKVEKEEREREGGKNVEKRKRRERVRDFSNLLDKKRRNCREDYRAIVRSRFARWRASEWVMLYSLFARPCGVSDRPSAPLNSAPACCPHCRSLYLWLARGSRGLSLSLLSSVFDFTHKRVRVPAIV